MLTLLLSGILMFSPVYAEVTTVAGTGIHGSRDGSHAQFNLPASVFGGEDGLYVTDTFNNMVRRIDSDGYVHRVTGSILGVDRHNFPLGFYVDAVVDYALFNRPVGVAADSYGRVFIADSMNNVIRVIYGEYVFTFAGREGPGHADGRYYEAMFYRPSAIALGPDGTIFVADTLNHVIRAIDLNDNVRTIAGIPGVYGHNDGRAGSARFNSPMGIAVAEDGRIFVADTGNHLIRVIENGRVSTVAGSVLFPADIAWEDPDSDFDNVPIGGFADGYEAMFNLPKGLSLWGEILVVADSANHMIRAVLPAGEVITLAGTGTVGHTDGPALEAGFHLPQGVYVRGGPYEYRLYIADTGNNKIRVLVIR